MRKKVDYRSLGATIFVRRSELPDCIEARHGVRFAVSRFNKFPGEGGGPPFTKLGRLALYRIDWVDAWFAEEVKRRMRVPIGRK